jgi:hypothetical protein
VVEAATEVLTGFADAYQHHWAEGMAAKLGLAAPDRVNPVYIRAITASRRRWPRRPTATWAIPPSGGRRLPPLRRAARPGGLHRSGPHGRRPVRHLLRHLSMSPTMLTAVRPAYSARLFSQAVTHLGSGHVIVVADLVVT